MDNDFINDFIEEYKNQPCLWQASSSDFKDRKKRQEAYYKLIEVASKHGEHYNIERTKQKINNLRCAFRHQLKKLTESKNNKTGKEDGYCPKRRYIESLMFLLNEEQSESAKVDNLKATPAIVTKVKKSNNTSSVNCNEPISKSTKIINRNEKQQIPPSSPQVICEIIIPPGGDKAITNTDDNSSKKEQQQDKQQQQPTKEIIIKSTEDAIVESTIKEQQQQNPVHIEMQCNDDDGVNLLWQRSGKTIQKTIETSTTSIPLPITTSTPVTISTEPLAVSIISSAIPISSVPSITTTSTVLNNTLESSINTSRPRTTSTSSQNSSHIIAENAPKKIKIDCSSTNFDKLLSLACSKINAIMDCDDDFAVFGRMVSYKLRSMEPQQAIIAEKMITDILLEGQMKMLTYPFRNATTASSTTTIPASFRQEDGQPPLVINLNGNNTSTTTDPHQHHSLHHHQSDSSKCSSQNIQYSNSTGNNSQ